MTEVQSQGKPQYEVGTKGLGSEAEARRFARALKRRLELKSTPRVKTTVLRG